MPTYVADLKGAASVGNLYGKAAVAAESLTAFGRPWAFAPADLKRTVDTGFALGVNRIHIHESAHQPLPDAAPGMALATFLGQYFNRNETWAPMADGWIDYLSRSSFLLQQGYHGADISYSHGEEAPLTSLLGKAPPADVPPGHDYDFVNAEALMSRLTAHDGRLATPDGQSYRVLYLGGDSQRMTLATLRRVRDVLAAVWCQSCIAPPRKARSGSSATPPGRRHRGGSICAEQAVFIVLHKPATAPSRTVALPRTVTAAGRRRRLLATIRLQPWGRSSWSLRCDQSAGKRAVMDFLRHEGRMEVPAR